MARLFRCSNCRRVLIRATRIGPPETDSWAFDILNDVTLNSAQNAVHCPQCGTVNPLDPRVLDAIRRTGSPQDPDKH